MRTREVTYLQPVACRYILEILSDYGIVENADRSDVTRPRPLYHALNHHNQEFPAHSGLWKRKNMEDCTGPGWQAQMVFLYRGPKSPKAAYCLFLA